MAGKRAKTRRATLERVYTPGLPVPTVPAGAPTVGVVLEGGGFRGMYTSGVTDVWMENGITATATVGVSAGTTFGCNFKSLQAGRALRYNKRFWEFDVFDTATFQANPMRFTVVATDANTGEPVYHDLDRGGKEDIEWIRASASIPALSRPVRLEGRELLDGGTSDSIPYAWMLDQGYDRCVVVLTQDAAYRKEPNNLMPAIRVLLRRYPAMVELLANRHERYNRQREKLFELERAGKVFVVCPSEPVRVPAVVRDPEVLDRIYAIGRRDAERTLDALRAYLA